MILDIPYLSRVYDLQKDSSRFLAYLEETRHEYEPGKFKVFYSVKPYDNNNTYINDLGICISQFFAFGTKEAAMKALKMHFIIK